MECSAVIDSAPRIEQIVTEKSVRTLLIEDDPASYEIWKLLLRRLIPEIELYWAMNGRDVEAIIETDIRSRYQIDSQSRSEKPFFDLAISDVILPDGKSGIDIWRNYRDHFRIFVVSSGLSRDQYQKLFREQEDAPMFIPKPTTPRIVIEKLGPIVRHYFGL